MAAGKRRNFSNQRRMGTRRYKQLIVIACEGRVTEAEYFKMLNAQQFAVHFKCIPRDHKSSPGKVLRAMETYLKQNELRPGDEAWLVVDTDSWSEASLQQLWNWACKKENYGLAVSNPKFEFWLLLHFEPGHGASTASSIEQRLNKYSGVPGKHLEKSLYMEANIHKAIQRAKSKDHPPCKDWPRNAPGTTVYHLVERFPLRAETVS